MEFFKKSKGDGHEIIRMEILFLIPGFFVVIFIMNYSKLTTTQKSRFSNYRYAVFNSIDWWYYGAYKIVNLPVYTMASISAVTKKKTIKNEITAISFSFCGSMFCILFMS